MATASCDAALALHMLHHVTDLAQTVGELSRVVKQGGLV
ncbi:ubiquinone/menaquinone biosynthesis C-methylase UbiE [Streptomyces rapamycinicus]|nr:ubiquinone/menaquinone biosynthesis C-methylase UbiE [Streptomyces rapamycinicus]